MKSTMMALAAAAGLGVFAGAAAADPGGYAPPGPNAAAPLGQQMGGPGTLIGAGNVYDRAPDCYGWSPCIKKLFRLGSHGEANTPKNALKNPANWAAGGYGVGGPAYNPNGFPPGAYGPMQGTLVFPNHPFVRSPRDFFMLDLNK